MLGIGGAPLAWLYATGLRARHYFYDYGVFQQHHASVPVISVGGIEIGGTGKTPVASYVLQRLLASHHQPTLISRGYGRPKATFYKHLRDQTPHWERLGDETTMLVQRHPVDAIVTPKRRIALSHLEADSDCIVLEDGFSHRSVARDLDIAVLDGNRPTGALIPQGRMRELPSRLRSAQVLWLYHRVLEPDRSQHVALTLPDQILVQSRVRTKMRWVSAPFNKAVAISAIAKPQHFENDATAHLEVIHHLRYKDHHSYSVQDWRHIQNVVQSTGAEGLVTTEKDWVKLSTLQQSEMGHSLPIGILEQALEILEGQQALESRLRSLFKSSSPEAAELASLNR